MEFSSVSSNSDLTGIIHVLNVSHGTVTKEFGFTKENNPTNNAFIDVITLKSQLEKGIQLFALSVDSAIIGCIAIEKSSREPGLFYIEKVSVIPEFRNKGYGKKMMVFATEKILEQGGSSISIALIDSNLKLKKWYSSQGFKESGIKDFDHLPFRVCFMSKPI